jgi:uncharacterized membrane protein YjjP (DUF1212 family)
MARIVSPRFEWPLVVSAAVALAGLLVTMFDGWRDGVVLFSCGVLLAGLLRLLLTDDQAGLLRVRRRPFDVLALFGMGAVILALGLLVPDLPR